MLDGVVVGNVICTLKCRVCLSRKSVTSRRGPPCACDSSVAAATLFSRRHISFLILRWVGKIKLKAFFGYFVSLCCVVFLSKPETLPPCSCSVSLPININAANWYGLYLRVRIRTVLVCVCNLRGCLWMFVWVGLCVYLIGPLLVRLFQL